MKKKLIFKILVTCVAATMLVGGCGKKDPEPVQEEIEVVDLNLPGQDEVEEEAEAPEAGEDRSQYLVTAKPAPAGQVYNEFTGLLIDESIKDQRPLAIMVDNERTALDHFGVNDADIVYEMVNSTLNDRITRFMCVIKDWGKIEQFGSVRSARVTNCYLAGEYNAILCHDGGPFYINDYVNKPEVDHLSGVFSRVNNGKSREFTEYVKPGDLQKYILNAENMSQNYNEYYTGDHFLFAESDAMRLNTFNNERSASEKIELPYKHNGSKLFYNKDTGLYDYYEYGAYHKDGATGEILSFKNLIIQKAHMGVYDDHGYMVFDIVYNNGEGYYIADGKCVDITWEREGLTDNTVFRGADGEPIVLNAGHTYIAIVPDDSWDQVVIQ